MIALHQPRHNPLNPTHPHKRFALSLRRFLFLSFCLFPLIFANNKSFAQETAAAPADEDVIRVATNLVTIPVRVTDGRGRPVAGLRKTDFALYRGAQLIPPDYFAAGTERVALTFMLDESSSARDTITQQNETALALFSRFGRNSRLSVIHFREHPEIVLPFSSNENAADAHVDTAAARRAFRLNAEPNRRTAIFDAALAAVRAVAAATNSKQNARHQLERRIVILLTDGLDTASTISYKDAIAAAQTYGVSFYVINIPLFVPGDGHLVARKATRGVRELAERTGGRYFVVGDAQSALNPRAEYDLAPIFAAIAADLQSQYVLGYYARGETNATTTRMTAAQVRLTSPGMRRYRVSVLH